MHPAASSWLSSGTNDSFSDFLKLVPAGWCGPSDKPVLPGSSGKWTRSRVGFQLAEGSLPAELGRAP
jgi:hypothetical protein